MWLGRLLVGAAGATVIGTAIVKQYLERNDEPGSSPAVETRATDAERSHAGDSAGSSLGRVRSPQATEPGVVAPSRWQAASQAAHAAAVGQPEVVFSYRKDACNRRDHPDVAAHAVRLADGNVMLTSGSQPDNYASFGPDLSRVRRSCRPMFRSSLDDEPQSLKNRGWLIAPYRIGAQLVALVHNEYHDPRPTTCRVGRSDPGNPCWYNGITVAVGTPEPLAFVNAASDWIAAAPGVAWQAPQRSIGRKAGITQYGYFAPSNIVSRDGWYYALMRSIPGPRQNGKGGICVMRTRTPGSGSSWRAWDGTGFGLAVNGFYANAGKETLQACAPVIPAAYGLSRSLTYNTYFKRYMAVGSGGASDTTGCGAFFSLSEDLINWDPPRLFYGADCRPVGGRPSPGVVGYPSLIDPADTSTNFENTGQTPYLYYVRNNNGPDRDLMRVKIRFGR